MKILIEVSDECNIQDLLASLFGQLLKEEVNEVGVKCLSVYVRNDEDEEDIKTVLGANADVYHYEIQD